MWKGEIWLFIVPSITALLRKVVLGINLRNTLNGRFKFSHAFILHQCRDKGCKLPELPLQHNRDRLTECSAPSLCKAMCPQSRNVGDGIVTIGTSLRVGLHLCRKIRGEVVSQRLRAQEKICMKASIWKFRVPSPPFSSIVRATYFLFWPACFDYVVVVSVFLSFLILPPDLIINLDDMTIITKEMTLLLLLLLYPC